MARGPSTQKGRSTVLVIYISCRRSQLVTGAFRCRICSLSKCIVSTQKPVVLSSSIINLTLYPSTCTLWQLCTLVEVILSSTGWTLLILEEHSIWHWSHGFNCTQSLLCFNNCLEQAPMYCTILPWCSPWQVWSFRIQCFVLPIF